MQQGVEVLIDYFTMTVKGASDPWQVVTDWLGMDVDLFHDEDFSVLRGYTRMLSFSGICVAYAGLDKIEKRSGTKIFDGQQMGVCVSMSGVGCRTFERFSSRGQIDSDSAFPSLFADIVADGTVNVTRCDVACDDRSGLLSLEDIRQCVADGDVNTRLRKRAVYLNYVGTEYEGVGVYIGSPKSDFRIRFYDKALEQEQKMEGQWIRCEMVFRHEEALGFVCALVQMATTVGKLAAQVLNDKFAFIVRDDSNISRCTVCDWWAKFVDALEAVALVSRKRVQQPVERVAEWFRCSLGPTLVMLWQTLGYEWLYGVAHDKDIVERLGRKREALIRDFHAYHSGKSAIFLDWTSPEVSLSTL